MSHPVTRLYPLPPVEQPLAGLYLSHDLRGEGTGRDAAFVYSNFVASVDGRIAVPGEGDGGLTVPKKIANDRDWRLFQELAAQADIIISSGRYLRDWAAGNAQEILEVDDPRFADLRGWRRDQGLRPQPDLAIISGSLRFPTPDALTANGRRFVVFTTADPAPARVAEIETAGGDVVVAGDESVDGRALVDELTRRGYRTVYSAAGPKVMHLLLSAGVLDRLYLTYANRILAGDPFASIVQGESLAIACDLKLNTLYFDPHGLNGLGQLFAAYDKV